MGQCSVSLYTVYNTQRTNRHGVFQNEASLLDPLSQSDNQSDTHHTVITLE